MNNDNATPLTALEDGEEGIILSLAGGRELAGRRYEARMDMGFAEAGARVRVSDGKGVGLRVRVGVEVPGLAAVAIGLAWNAHQSFSSLSQSAGGRLAEKRCERAVCRSVSTSLRSPQARIRSTTGSQC